MKKTLFLASFFFTILLNSQTLTSNSSGSFTYTPTGPLSSKPIKVFYRIPTGDITKMPILMSFHGDDRNALENRDFWVSMANSNKFMVFTPEFSDDNFPGGDAYNLANIFDDGDNPTLQSLNPSNEWTFSVLDPLFEHIKSAVSGTQEKYNAWGHSAGAQFLQRFVLYMPNSKLDIAVCSNAGWYTVPELEIDFPYGLKKSQLSTNTLETAFSKKVIIHLGMNDTNPNSAGLRHNTVVDNQQGLNRLVRGRYFYTTSQATAQEMDVLFNWEKDEVANVGHEGQLMANDALEHVLKSTLSIKEINLEKSFSVYPNPSKNSLFFDNSKLKSTKIIVFSGTGKQLMSIPFSDFLSSQEIDISSLSTGIYVLKSDSYFSRIIKN